MYVCTYIYRLSILPYSMEDLWRKDNVCFAIVYLAPSEVFGT